MYKDPKEGKFWGNAWGSDIVAGKVLLVSSLFQMTTNLDYPLPLLISVSSSVQSEDWSEQRVCQWTSH